jgi:hypothetical protein
VSADAAPSSERAEPAEPPSERKDDGE